MERIITAIKEAQSLWKIILCIYAFQFILAATIGLQMMQVLDASLGNSLSLEKLESGFDYTVFTDFVNVHGGSFSVLYGQMRWMVLTYLIFASLISTGIIYCLIHKSSQISDFFKGSLQMFFKLFIVDVVFAILILAIMAISFALTGMLFGIAPTSFDTELVFLRWTLLISIIALLLIFVLTLWKIHIKFKYIKSDQRIFNSIGSGFKSFWANKWRYIAYTFFFLIISLILISMNYAAGDLPLFPMIILIQFIALIKVFLRIVFYKVIGT